MWRNLNAVDFWVMAARRVRDSSLTQESSTRRKSFSHSLLQGIGEPFPACNVTYELGRERDKGHEMTWEDDEKESITIPFHEIQFRCLILHRLIHQVQVLK
jgi:hypothetical protein